jgi:large subunit ribosomal protein L21
MYAVVETGGKQYRVAPQDVIDVEKIEGQPGDEIELDKVLMVGRDEGVEVGSPYLENARVKAVIEKHGKGRKITVFKYKNKSKQSRRTQGHRQHFTRLRIGDIEA